MIEQKHLLHVNVKCNQNLELIEKCTLSISDVRSSMYQSRKDHN